MFWPHSTLPGSTIPWVSSMVSMKGLITLSLRMVDFPTLFSIFLFKSKTWLLCVQCLESEQLRGPKHFEVAAAIVVLLFCRCCDCVWWWDDGCHSAGHHWDSEWDSVEHGMDDECTKRPCDGHTALSLTLYCPPEITCLSPTALS